MMELPAHAVSGRTELFHGCPPTRKDVPFEKHHLPDGRMASGRRLDGVITVK